MILCFYIGINQDVISTTVRTRNDEEKILTPMGFEPASPRLSRPGSLINSPTKVPYVSDNFKSSYYVHTRSTWLLNTLSDS